MSSLLTVLLPGLAQMQAGQMKKAGTMFLVALFFGVASGGIGWLICGLWSLFDAKSATARPTATPATAQFGVTSPAPVAKASMAPWVFKFAVLGVGATIALYSISQGRALNTLKFLGIELSFAESMGELASDDAATGGVETADVLGGSAANAFNASNDPKATFDDPKATVVSDMEPAPSGGFDITGTWKGSTGSSYSIAQNGSSVSITEKGYLFLLPVETGRCDGTVRDGAITASCFMSNNVTGTMYLSPGADGSSLVGRFQEQTTGFELPLVFQR